MTDVDDKETWDLLKENPQYLEKLRCASEKIDTILERWKAPSCSVEACASEWIELVSLTSINPIHLLDAIPPEIRGPFGEAVAQQIRTWNEQKVHRARILLTVWTLAQTERWGSLASTLARDLHDPYLRTLLTRFNPTEESSIALEGEMTRFVARPVWKGFLATTGLLLFVHLFRLIARWFFGYRALAQVKISKNSIALSWQIKIFGKVLREKRILFDRNTLAWAGREVRYPMLAFYTGIFMLAVGSYIGTRSALDGWRVGSAELVAIGAAMVVGGIALDWILMAFAEGKDKSAIRLVHQKGGAFCIRGVDRHASDKALALLLS